MYARDFRCEFKMEVVSRGAESEGEEYRTGKRLVKVESVGEAASMDDLKEAVRKRYGTYCTHDYDCCGNWYHRAYIKPFGTSGLFELTITSHLNI